MGSTVHTLISIGPKFQSIRMITFPSILVAFLCVSTLVSAKHESQREVNCEGGGYSQSKCNGGKCEVTCPDGSVKTIKIDCKDGSVSINQNGGKTELSCGPPI